MKNKEIVLTGIGVLSSIGITRDDFWTALCEGRSGIGYLTSLETKLEKAPIGAAVPDFRAKDYVKPKKNIKVMSRDIQMAFVSVMNACEQAGGLIDSETRNIDPERLGVLYGCDLIGTEIGELADAFRAGIDGGHFDFSKWGPAAMEKVMPLWMLKYLPNMPACQVGIALDARGPNNSTTMERGSCLEAIMEASRVLERGDADVMVCGSVGNKINPVIMARAHSYDAEPWDEFSLKGPRPFDADRRWTVLSEGAGAFVLESEEFALARGAKPLARIVSYARTMAPYEKKGARRESIERALQLVLEQSGRTAESIGHVNADGVGTVHNDAEEAAAIRNVLGDVPVFAGKGYFGNAGSGAGAIELAASLMSLQHGLIPPTKNCDSIAKDCPIQVIRESALAARSDSFIKISHTNFGRAFALLVEKY